MHIYRLPMCKTAAQNSAQLFRLGLGFKQILLSWLIIFDSSLKSVKQYFQTC